MKISTKGRYGLRAMADMALNSRGEHVSLNSIAERQNISENYLEQVFSSLRKAGLVKSVKGAQGGYIIAGDPADITVGNILRVLEGSLSVADEKLGQTGMDIGMDKKSLLYCVDKVVWTRINESIDKAVDSITLEDLVNEYHKINNESTHMFYI